MEGYIPKLKAVPPWTADNHFLSLACISVCCAFFSHSFKKYLSRDQTAGRGDPAIYILVPNLSALPLFFWVYKPVWICCL